MKRSFLFNETLIIWTVYQVDILSIGHIILLLSRECTNICVEYT